MWTKESVSPPDLGNEARATREGEGRTEFVEENDARTAQNASSTCLTVITRARVHLLSAA